MKYRIAVGTKDGVYVTEHFGQCGRFQILEVDQEQDEAVLIEERDTANQTGCGGHQEEQIRDKIQSINDCKIVLVRQIGGQSEKLLNHNGIIALQYQGTIEGALQKVKQYYKRQKFFDPKITGYEERRGV